ncbi:hypothetical protein P3L10_029518 [Capsicum annuum]
MKRHQCKLFVCEEIIINILNRLPLKSLARLQCISKEWRKYIAEIYHCRLQAKLPAPYLIGFFCIEKRLQSRFFFSSKESPLLIGTGLDKSVSLIGERVYVVILPMVFFSAISLEVGRGFIMFIILLRGSVWISLKQKFVRRIHMIYRVRQSGQS